MESEPRTAGVHHVGLTVPDVRATSRFFVEHLGFRVVGERPSYPAIFVSDGVVMLTLWQASEPALARPFDRKNAIGLHHLALRTADELERLHARLASAPGVTIEFAPEPLGSSGLRHMMCATPCGLRIEFVASEDPS